jgi:uncharacterized protein YabE (DUF348 family)/3D (Asp-Asp-Asp) domain-containing protein
VIQERRVPFWRGVVNLLWALLRLLPSPGLWASIALLVVVGRAAVEYADGLMPLTLVVDGVPQQVRTHCATVGEVLDDLGVEVRGWDRLVPPRHVAVQSRMRVTLQRARRVTLVADGATRTLYTHLQQVGEVLDEAHVSLKAGDQLWVNGRLFSGNPVPVTAGLSIEVQPVGSVRSSPAGGLAASAVALHIEVRRAKQIHLHDGGVEQALRTTARTLGQALADAGILLYLGDHVHPDLNTLVRTGMHVYVERGIPVSILVDGRAIRTRTHSETVGQVLAEAGVSLVGKDFCVPEPETGIRAGLEIRVSRVAEKLIVEEEAIPFQTEWYPDASLELDHRRVDAVGTNGVRRRRYRSVHQDEVEIERRLEDEWIEREPEPRKIAYGTEIVIRTLETPDGPIEYWRRVHVFLTSYTEATCGKTPDHPWYGKTRLGWDMRHGIVAVDPRVINMLTEVYVPGYGRGIAADTGGMIIGRHIDLGHDVDDFVMWFEWGYVYLLTPPPSPDQIRWILPDFPRGRWP